MNNRKCKNCIYWDRHETPHLEDLQDPFGDCRINPPAALKGFPNTHGEFDWCGQFDNGEVREGSGVKMKNRACQYCVWWDEDGAEEETTGLCHYCPPAVHYKGTFPVTRYRDYCSEFDEGEPEDEDEDEDENGP